jgi:hypothetical protein
MESLAVGRVGHDNFHRHVAMLITQSGKSQKEIADGLGYCNANIITMFKNGNTRVPPEKVVPLAQMLNEPPPALLQAWLSAYMPGFLKDIRTHLCAP